ncbi:MAG: DUF86 domain-containing protein [Phycisphaerales bacterium]
MLESAPRATRICGTSIAELRADEVRQLAVVKCIEIVGEASSRVSAEGMAALPELAWRGMKTMRNRLIHGYDTIDIELVWRTIRDDLPMLIERLESALGESPNA